MTDYSKIVIYKIQHQDDETLLYVGSTCNFTRRKCQHKYYSKNEEGKQYNYKLYQMIRTNGNWEAFKMTQIKEFPCENRREAEAEEDKVMLELKATLNDHRASRSRKQHYIDNRDKISEQKKQYHIENRDRRLEYNNQR